MENKKSLRLWVFKKEYSNRIIGSVGFNNIVWGAFLSCHLGYKLDKDEINKGYMAEAIQKGIEANIMPKNKLCIVT